MSEILKKICYLLESPLIAARILVFLASILWAITLLWPNSNMSGSLYVAMFDIFGEVVWGILFLVISILQIVSIIANSCKTRVPLIISCLTLFFWGFVVALAYSTVYPPPPISSGNLAIALVSAWIVVKVQQPVCTGV